MTNAEILAHFDNGAPGQAVEVAGDVTLKILTERGNRYGKFEGHATVAQALKRVMHVHMEPKVFKDDAREALDMIQHKIARIINGDPEYIDNWDDIAGYARLVADRIRGTAR